MAQNTAFQNGDLILGFQAKGGTGADKTVLVNLGDTATVFRDATSTISNVTNVNSILSSTFGAGWFDNTNLYFGAIGVWTNIKGEGALRNGDPGQTIYVSKGRTTIGDESMDSSTITTPSASNQTQSANQIIGLNGTFEVQPNPTSQFSILNTTANTWEDFNPTTAGGVQSTAFTAWTGGIQQRFATGSFGTFSVGAVEGALDLYRSQGENDTPGQFDENGPLRVPQFQGIITVKNDGQVDFIAVPEPSSALLLGLASVLGLAVRRRRAIRA